LFANLLNTVCQFVKQRPLNLLANKYLLKKFGSLFVFYNKYCEKVVQREKKTGRLKNLLPFQPGFEIFLLKRAQIFSLYQREKKNLEISQI